jgi:hypothetical protein
MEKITTIIRDNKNPNNPIVVVSRSVQFMLLVVYMVTIDDFLVCYV